MAYESLKSFPSISYHYQQLLRVDIKSLQKTIRPAFAGLLVIIGKIYLRCFATMYNAYPTTEEMLIPAAAALTLSSVLGFAGIKSSGVSPSVSGCSGSTGAFSSRFSIASRTLSAAFLISSTVESGLLRTSSAALIASSRSLRLSSVYLSRSMLEISSLSSIARF